MTEQDNPNQPVAGDTGSVVAIDLGSNSFHLLEALVDDGRLVPATALASKVQLGLAMVDNSLATAAIQRGLSCLEDFSAYTRGRSSTAVRVVGTQALRQACNRQEFLQPASEILAQPIEVISGELEAELVFSGVVAGFESDLPLLVVDIGGGSTELVTGQSGTITGVASVPVGCVSYLRYFPGGTISETAITTARNAAVEAFAPFASQVTNGWQLAVGCSGTLLAVAQVLLRQGWLEGGHETAVISRQGLASLNSALLAYDSIEAVRFQGLGKGRRSIFASGVAIVGALFESFELEYMQLSASSLREGVAWSLLASKK